MAKVSNFKYNCSIYLLTVFAAAACSESTGSDEATVRPTLNLSATVCTPEDPENPSCICADGDTECLAQHVQLAATYDTYVSRNHSGQTFDTERYVLMDRFTGRNPWTDLTNVPADKIYSYVGLYRIPIPTDRPVDAVNVHLRVGNASTPCTEGVLESCFANNFEIDLTAECAGRLAYCGMPHTSLDTIHAYLLSLEASATIDNITEAVQKEIWMQEWPETGSYVVARIKKIACDANGQAWWNATSGVSVTWNYFADNLLNQALTPESEITTILGSTRDNIGARNNWIRFDVIEGVARNSTTNIPTVNELCFAIIAETDESLNFCSTDNADCVPTVDVHVPPTPTDLPEEPEPELQPNTIYLPLIEK